MKKEKLIERAKKRCKKCKEHKLHLYPRKYEEEYAEMSVAIIERLCELDGVTPYKAKEAIKMAADIIDEELLHETIS